MCLLELRLFACDWEIHGFYENYWFWEILLLHVGKSIMELEITLCIHTHPTGTPFRLNKLTEDMSYLSETIMLSLWHNETRNHETRVQCWIIESPIYHLTDAYWRKSWVLNPFKVTMVFKSLKERIQELIVCDSVIPLKMPWWFWFWQVCHRLTLLSKSFKKRARKVS